MKRLVHSKRGKAKLGILTQRPGVYYTYSDVGNGEVVIYRPWGKPTQVSNSGRFTSIEMV